MKKTSILFLLFILFGFTVSFAQSSSVNVDCTQTSKVVNSNYEFTSERIELTSSCNQLRFTLTESGAFYQNGAKRMSFDYFAIYDNNGKEVSLKAEWFSGNNDGKVFGNMLDGVNETFCAGAWASGNEDDYFEISLPTNIDLGGAFSFHFVTENETMNAKAFRIDLTQEARTQYTFIINAPEGKEVITTYNGESIINGTIFDAEAFDVKLFSANDIEGYTWSIVVDEEKKTITLIYTKVEITENPAAVVALINRIGGDDAHKDFKFVLDPSLNSSQEAFVLGAEKKKILIKGSTISAITTGIGWYLNNIANINIAWNLLNEKSQGEAYADLSDLPLPEAEEMHVCDAKYRYFLNYCTFGYSMTTWTWKRWQQEIDWMALHGINMPLQIVGLEEVWRQFLTMKENGVSKYNYSEKEAKAFVAGPAYTAWWGMNNLEGWGGTSADGWGGVQDDAWYARQTQLAQNILNRQRELGMQPVLPGFSGMVPSNFTSKTGVATDANGGQWGGFTRPRIIDPTAKRFAEIAADYYACLKNVMGESQYYSMDPFHEGGSISSGKYREAYFAIYEAMEAAQSGSQWVIQQWQWDGNQKLSVSAVPAGRLIVLDLFSDGKPSFDYYNGYTPQEAVFCALPNFGGRSGLMGRLNNLSDNYFAYKSKYPSIKGIGAAPEAIEQTPVTYDLIFQLPWMGKKPNMAEWIKQYANARYGQENAVAQEAWELLRQGVLNYGADAIQGPVEDVWAARPNLDAKPASTWGKTLNHAAGTYTKARQQMLIDATYKLLSQSKSLDLAKGSVGESNYLYDLVELGGGVMADYAYELLLGIKEAKTKAGATFRTDATFKARRDAFLTLIADMDEFKGTNLNFRLGKWTQEARDAAAEVVGATTANADWYEYNNARTLITVWGDQTQNSGLKDYSYRSWQGLLKDYYLPRWEYYFEKDCKDPASYFFFEWNWAHGKKHYVGQTAKNNTPLQEGEAGFSYSREPEGNTVDVATKLLEKYILPIRLNGKTHYAYRYLKNNLSSIVTIVAKAGEKIDLTPYFGKIEATIMGDFIDGEATDLSKIEVKADAADGSHIGTITLSDGTMLTFGVAINPAFYGTYLINYKNGSRNTPVFVAYNEDADNSRSKGYKLLATGTYSADAEADKIFTIEPCGAGFSLSAQGKYLKNPTLSGWNHLLFSDSKEEAGTYIMEETSTADVYKLRCTESGINYVNDYDKFIFGNDNASKEALSTFSFTPAETFPFTIPSAGWATVCFPFSVVMPVGAVAYDLPTAEFTKGENEGEYCCTLKPIALAGETLLAGTPAIVRAEVGGYALAITMQAAGAKGALEGSLLKGNFVRQTLAPTTGASYFVLTEGLDGIEAQAASESIPLAANGCWIEGSTALFPADATRLVFQFDTSVGIEETLKVNNQARGIYNLEGKRLTVPQEGINIVGGKKILIRK